jgi:hypothetical protein
LSAVAALIRLALFDAAFPHQLPAHLAKESLFVRSERIARIFRIPGHGFGFRVSFAIRRRISRRLLW